MPRSRTSAVWTFAITAIALFMVSLDNLVVTTALPVIRRDLGSSLQDLEWMVNAYTLTFAVLLLTGAALGDRFGRRRLFVIGLAIFTAGSAAAALAPSSTFLIAARAVQGLGGAIVIPLTLTILSASVSPGRRALALGAWGGIGGLAIAVGPLVGGAIAQGVNWHWIFWLTVPVGIVVVVLASLRLQETRGPEGRLDLAGLALASGGLLGLVWAVIHGNDYGWTDPRILGGFALGAVLLVLFAAWERRTDNPMLPLHMFRSRAFAAANAVSLLMYFGMFGSIFLLSQFFQIVQGLNPFEAGLRVLPWTAMPAFVAPIAGLLAGRIGSRPILVPGLALMALGLVWAVIHGNDDGWTSPGIVGAFAVGAILLVLFGLWEGRTSNPMLPLHMFRSRAFAAANAVSLLMYFGMFGSIFLLSQFFQVVQGLNPFEAGLRVLPWTAMPAVVAPIAGLVAGRIGSRPVLVVGLTLMAIGLAWLAAISSPTAPYTSFVPAFVVSGIGMGMFFAPIANVVLSAVYPEEEGKASGANNAIREVGGVFGVAVLASVFSANGSFASPQAYVNGLVPAVWLGAAVVAVAAVVALAIPARVAAGIRGSVTVPTLSRQRTDVDLAG